MDLKLYDDRIIPGDEAAKVIERVGRLGVGGVSWSGMRCGGEVLRDHFGYFDQFDRIASINDGYVPSSGSRTTVEGRAKHVAKFLRRRAK
jgi:hypothetical protein